MNNGQWQTLSSLAIGAVVVLAAIMVLGMIIDATEQPDIGPPDTAYSAI